jgi:predicted Holliday junction resolvase-like endonuclease
LSQENDSNSNSCGGCLLFLVIFLLILDACANQNQINDLQNKVKQLEKKMENKTNTRGDNQ